MKFSETKLAGSYIVELTPVGDSRGWFARTFCKREFEQIGHDKEWVQLNHSFTALKGTIRGMHYQVHPYGEIKMVRCIAGAVFDVIIDLRKDSPTFLEWFGVELSSTNNTMIYIPVGFAHGFQALTDNAELLYHHTEYFTPDAEAGIRYDDSSIKIEWPLPVSELSQRDSSHPIIDSTFKGL